MGQGEGKGGTLLSRWGRGRCCRCSWSALRACARSSSACFSETPTRPATSKRPDLRIRQFRPPNSACGSLRTPPHYLLSPSSPTAPPPPPFYTSPRQSSAAPPQPLPSARTSSHHFSVPPQPPPTACTCSRHSSAPPPQPTPTANTCSRPSSTAPNRLYLISSLPQPLQVDLLNPTKDTANVSQDLLLATHVTQRTRVAQLAPPKPPRLLSQRENQNQQQRRQFQQMLRWHAELFAGPPSCRDDTSLVCTRRLQGCIIPPDDGTCLPRMRRTDPKPYHLTLI